MNSYIMLNLLEMKIKKSQLSVCLKANLLDTLHKNEFDVIDVISVIELTSMYGVMKNSRSQFLKLIEFLGNEFKVIDGDNKRTKIEYYSYTWVVYHDLQESWLIDLLVELMGV